MKLSSYLNTLSQGVLLGVFHFMFGNPSSVFTTPRLISVDFLIYHGLTLFPSPPCYISHVRNQGSHIFSALLFKSFELRIVLDCLHVSKIKKKKKFHPQTSCKFNLIKSNLCK